MSHPLEMIRPESRFRVLVALSVVVTALDVVFTYFGQSLTTPQAPSGGLSLQLAGDPLVVASILGSWGAPQLALAENLLVLDYTFLVCYSTLIALGCIAVSRYWADKSLARVGIYLAWGQWLAALFDAMENTALLSVLRSASTVRDTLLPNSFVVTLGWFSTMGKWWLIEAGLLYIAASIAYRVVESWRASRRAAS